MQDDFSVKVQLFDTPNLGECVFNSPLHKIKTVLFHDDDEGVLYDREFGKMKEYAEKTGVIRAFERAGMRRKIFFDPRWCKAAILTAGGLCPGLNDVIKSLTLTLRQVYGVPMVYGIRYGYAGLNPELAYEPIILNEEIVDDIHEDGGTILGSSRGQQDPEVMLETLIRLDIKMLFCIGGDGTLRSAHAIAEAAKKRGVKISVIGIPKTVDNDICYIDRTFGFETAVYATTDVISAAHNEANGALNGVGLIHVMGRDSGFIAAYATLANTHVNFCLVPEESFTLEDGPKALLPALADRIRKRQHAVIMVAEGAGQDLMPGDREIDKSGNKLNKNIGLFLKEEIKNYAKKIGLEMNVKYFDPTYQLRACAANGTDAVFCLMLAQNAVHAAMAGRTDILIGHWSGTFTHVPIPLAVEKRKKIDLQGSLWQAVRLRTWHKTME